MKRNGGAFLLDVNVVLAVIDPAHQHHGLAWNWFASFGRRSFAMCPLVENGVLRIASSPAYPNRPGDVDIVRSVLDRLCAEPGCEFWPDSVSLRALLPPESGIRSNEVSDLYLVALARANAGRLATFDQKIRVAIVSGASNVEVLRP